MKSTIEVTEKEVTIYHPEATVTVNLDETQDYFVAVNRHRGNAPTEVIPQKRGKDITLKELRRALEITCEEGLRSSGATSKGVKKYLPKTVEHYLKMARGDQSSLEQAVSFAGMMTKPLKFVKKGC